jgi:hypothetical protein
VHGSTHCVKLIKNLYGQKQVGSVWNDYLVKGLQDRDFIQSKVDECVFYKGKTILLVYVDDAIFCGPSSKDIDDIITSLKKDFNVTDEGRLMISTWESRSLNLPKTPSNSGNHT